MGDLNDGPYNKSVKMALAKAIKTDVLRSGFIIPLRKWPKGLGTIAFRDSWDILIKSWFRNRSFNKFLFKYWKAGIYNKFFLYKRLASTKDTQTAFRRKWVSVIIFQFIFI
jgi:hypothetical protein